MNTRKEIKDAYRQSKPPAGIFQIKNLTTGKRLIDSAVNLNAIWNRYQMELKTGGCRNRALQADWKEFGEANFEFSILSEIEQKDDETIDLKKELALLKTMVLDELGINPEELY